MTQPNADNAAPTADRPVADPQRIHSIDVLRGVAVLGILVMNIQAFAMIFPAYNNPHAYGDLSGPNYAIWLLSHVLADRKFMTIFALLFGAGVVLFTSRREHVDGHSASLHYRRMAALLGIGLVHAYLLWDGDILVTYAVCGMVVFPMRQWRPRPLIVTGLVAIAIPSLLSLLLHWSMPHWPQSEVQSLTNEFWSPTPDVVQADLALHRGSWLGMLPDRVESANFVHTFVLLFENLWRVCGLMLAGMALFKLGVFNATLSTRTYAGLAAAGLLVGLPLVLGGVWYKTTVDWDMRRCFFLATQFNYWGSLPLAIAWIALMMLACQADALAAVRRPLAAVGQMAFTNYLLQTVICTTLFYGYGFGWYGRVERTGQLQVVLCIWVALLVISPLWLKVFRFGPAEWLWRSLTYGTRQPFRR